MAKPFYKYILIKDNYCCLYLGDSPEYVILLKLLKPQIEEQLPGLKFWIGCKDKFKYIIKDTLETFTLEEFDKNNFSYTRELRDDQTYHSVFKLMEESQLQIKPINIKQIVNSKLCLISPESSFSNKSINESQLKSIINSIYQKGYEPIVLKPNLTNEEKIKYVQNFGWVVGPENEYLLLGASLGLKATLINTGTGGVLYKKLFPNIDIISTKM